MGFCKLLSGLALKTSKLYIACTVLYSAYYKQRGVYATVERPSIRLYVPSFDSR